MLDRQTEAAIRADAQGLSERWDDGGMPALVRTIDDRLAQNVDDDAIYLLVDPAGQPHRRQPGAGPRGVERRPAASYELPVERAGMRPWLACSASTCRMATICWSAATSQLRAQLRALLTDALLWALLIVLAMATVGALIVRSLFRRTLAQHLGHRRGHRRRRFQPARAAVRPRR